MVTAAVTRRPFIARGFRYDELLLASGVLAVAQVEIWTGAPDPAWAFAALAVPMCLSLAWWRRAPGVVLAVVIASQLPGALIEVQYAPLYQLFSFLAACFALAARAPLAKAIIGGIAAEAMFVVGGLLDPDPKSAGDWLFVTAMVTGTWFVGRTLYGRDRAVDLLEQRFGRQDEETRALAREQQERIARDGLDGQSLPLSDDSCDTAVSTWTLCTIPDVAAALHEVRRVLKPGGTLHFVEHGLAPDEKVRRWQHRLEPLQKRLFGGCHLTREIADLLTDAGFAIIEVDVFYEKGAPKILAADTLGIAVAP